MSEDDAINQVQEEILETKRKQNVSDELEIEIVDESQPEPQEAQPEENAEQQPEDEEYGKNVQRRIKKLVDQRREVEGKYADMEAQNKQLQARLERLEQGTQARTENEFQQRYAQTRAALHKAVEEGDTDAQVTFQEQLADMRAAMRVAEMQKQMRAQQAASPTVGHAQQTATNPPPEKANSWWQKNRWFNATGFERETAAARAIDVQLDVEGFDKHSDEYYEMLDFRLQKMFPELKSEEESPVKARAKSRSPVTPAAGGSTYKGNRIRLTQDQLRMARELGITDEAGLKKYEAEVRRQMKG